MLRLSVLVANRQFFDDLVHLRLHLPDDLPRRGATRVAHHDAVLASVASKRTLPEGDAPSSERKLPLSPLLQRGALSTRTPS